MWFSRVYFRFFNKYQVHISVLTYIWIFHSIPLNNMSILWPSSYCFCYYDSVVQFEVMGGNNSNTFLIWDCFGYPDRFFFFLVFIWSRKLFFQDLLRIVLEFWWRLHWIFRLILVEWPFFMISIWQIHKHERSFHFLIIKWCRTTFYYTFISILLGRHQRSLLLH